MSQDGDPVADAFVTDPTGATHAIIYPLALDPNALIGESADGTGIRVQRSGAGSFQIVDRSGRTVTGTPNVRGLSSNAYTVSDLDGNTISRNITRDPDHYLRITDNGWVDSVGRSIPGGTVVDYRPGYHFVAGSAVPWVTAWVSGLPSDSSLDTCPSGSTAAQNWAPPLPDGKTGSYIFCFSDIALQTAFNLPILSAESNAMTTVAEAVATKRLVTAVVLPTGRSGLSDMTHMRTLPTSVSPPAGRSTITGSRVQAI